MINVLIILAGFTSTNLPMCVVATDDNDSVSWSVYDDLHKSSYVLNIVTASHQHGSYYCESVGEKTTLMGRF
jgi:hypothetical protein